MRISDKFQIGVAHGAYTRKKFLVCLPFNRGGTGKKNGTTKKFERIAESDFSWSMGLSHDTELGSTCFWRLEIEVHRKLNAIVLVVSRFSIQSLPRTIYTTTANKCLSESKRQ
uniref:MATH domain-containing protein n=1 Tax=Angiostrongylus cantonensis TaxID=6313 RepID=A0A158P711_ANGCA